MKRTERELHIALGKLLDRVRVSNSWNKDSFYSAAAHVVNVNKAEAIRFYDALLAMDLLRPGNDRRKNIPNFDSIIWKNEDARINLIRDIIGCFPDIVQHRGRVAGKKYAKVSGTIPEVVKETIPEIACIQEDVINPLSIYEAIMLVEELRNRGFSVTCTRQLTIIEEL